jgi:hypothetical protein
VNRMSPFRRGRRDQSSPRPAIDLKVQETVYRRLGEALANVVVTLGEAPPADARLVIRTNSSDQTTVLPMMVTREAPGTDSEAHRIWFAVELSAVMFGDGEFALTAGDGEEALPHPTAQRTPSDDDSETEAVLRAALASLEERCRELQRANAELTDDARRMREVMAQTLEDVQRERERLLEQLARGAHDPG